MDDELEGLNALARAMAESAVSCEEAAEAADRLAEVMSRAMSDETMIHMIRLNPSLNCFEKWRLIRKLRKEARNG